MAKAAYIILTHKYIPKNGESKWEVIEDCEFVDRVKNKHLTEATVIINVTKKVLEKNRVTHADYDSYIKHINKTYPEKYQEFLDEIKSKNLI